MASPEVERLVLPASPRAVGLARAFVAAVLDRWGSSHLADATVLLTSELVTNALVHADSPSTLTLEPEQPADSSARVEAVRVSVTDTSPTGPGRRRHSLTATTGRGLQLLDQLADSWGWDADGDGKVVWFVVTGAVLSWDGAVSTEGCPEDFADAEL